MFKNVVILILYLNYLVPIFLMVSFEASQKSI